MSKQTKWQLDPLPVKLDLETKLVLKRLPRAHAVSADTIKPPTPNE